MLDNNNGTRSAGGGLHNGDNPLADLATEYLETLLRGERRTASELILDSVEKGVSVKEIYLHVFQPCQHEIGRLWQTNQVSVAEEHYVTAATQLIMSQLYPRVFSTQKMGRRLVVTCVSGELHEIGVRMVADFFEMEGRDAYYLGANTPTESILETLEMREADILAISATITFNLEAVSEMIAKVRERDVGKRVRILAGGRPFNLVEDLWKRVGADSYAPGAQDAIVTAEQLVSGM